MLVLSRHRDESIMIGDDVRITIVDIRGDKVRLGSTRHRKSLCTARKFTTQSNVRIKRPAVWGQLRLATLASKQVGFPRQVAS